MLHQDAKLQRTGVRPALAIISGIIVTLLFGFFCYEMGLSRHSSSEPQGSERASIIEQPAPPNFGQKITADNSNLHPIVNIPETNIAKTNLANSPASNEATPPDTNLAAALARIAELESTIDQLQAKQADTTPTNGNINLTGTWFNTNQWTRGITRVTIPDGPWNDLSIMVWTAASPKDFQRPTVPLHRLILSSDTPFPVGCAIWDDSSSPKTYLLVQFHPDGISTEFVIVGQKPAGVTPSGFYFVDGLAPAF